MPTEYTDKVAALARAKERAGIADTSLDETLNEYLDLSAGTVDSVTHYRPFWVAAFYLMQNIAGQRLSEADGVVFTGDRTPILSLLFLQNAYDRDFGLTIPKGFEANWAAIANLLKGEAVVIYRPTPTTQMDASPSF